MNFLELMVNETPNTAKSPRPSRQKRRRVVKTIIMEGWHTAYAAKPTAHSTSQKGRRAEKGRMKYKTGQAGKTVNQV